MTTNEVTFFFNKASGSLDLRFLKVEQNSARISVLPENAAAAMTAIFKKLIEKDKPTYEAPLLGLGDFSVTLLTNPDSQDLALKIETDSQLIDIKKLTSETAALFLNPLSATEELVKSLTTKPLSCPQKRELVRKTLDELQKKGMAKEEPVHSLLETLSKHVDLLINIEDPLVEPALDHIQTALLACTSSNGLKEEIEKLSGQVNLVLMHLEVEELDRKLEAEEAQMLDATAAYLDTPLTVKLGNAQQYLTELNMDNLKRNLENNKQCIQKHEVNLAAQLKEKAEFDDLLKPRTVSELKAKITNFVSQHAANPFFQNMLKMMESVHKCNELLKEYESAFWKKPILMAQIMSYGPSLQRLAEELKNTLPEKVFQAFFYLLVDYSIKNAKDVFGKTLEEALPDTQTLLLSEVGALCEKMSNERKSIEQYNQANQRLELLLKISQDRKELLELYQHSPEAKEAIERLENTEYQMPRELLKQYRDSKVPGSNPIEHKMEELTWKELFAIRKPFIKAKEFYRTQYERYRTRISS